MNCGCHAENYNTLGEGEDGQVSGCEVAWNPPKGNSQQSSPAKPNQGLGRGCSISSMSRFLNAFKHAAASTVSL